MRIPRHVSEGTVFVAWLMFIVSFLLPATNVVELGGKAPGTPLTGWQAFTSSLMVLVAQPLIVVAEPRTLLFFAFPLMNLAGLFAPLVVLAWDKSWLVSSVYLVFGALPWVFPKSVTGDLFLGFYLWDLSFLLTFIGTILVSVSRSQFYEDEIRRLQGNTVGIRKSTPP